MLVFWKERLVFLATPKTGTTAIESALAPLASIAIENPPQLKHTSVRRYGKFLAPFLRSAGKEDFTVVALMREPLSWLGSWYRYRQRDDVPRAERSTEGMSFEEFALAYLSDPKPDFAAVGTQARFLSAGPDTCDLRIFRYEEIAQFVAFLEDRLDFEIILPQVNVSPKSNLDLSEQTEAQLRQALSADYALYRSLAATR